jgi:hypothetical protein
MQKLGAIENDIAAFSQQLVFRRNFSAYLFLLFIGLSVVVFLLSKTYEKK